MGQTSIEWLINELIKEKIIADYSPNSGYVMFDKAKELHKKETEEAFDRGVIKGEAPNEYRINGEQYYNEKYSK